MDALEELKLVLESLTEGDDIDSFAFDFGRQRGIPDETVQNILNGVRAQVNGHSHEFPVADEIHIDYPPPPPTGSATAAQERAATLTEVRAEIEAIKGDRKNWSHTVVEAIIFKAVRARLSEAEMNDFKDWATSHVGMTRRSFEDYKKRAVIANRPKDDEQLILFKSMPWESAHEFVAREGMRDGNQCLRHWRGSFYFWVVTHYEQIEDEKLTNFLWRFLAGANTYGSNGELMQFNPTTSAVNEVLQALKAVCETKNVDAPFWLDDNDDEAGEVISLKNGLLRLKDKKFIPHTPNYFNLGATGIEYHPQLKLGAKSRWLQFVNETFPGDQESINTLQEIMGYLLTADTSQQKIFALVGAPRSGKGTILRIITSLVGSVNHTVTQFGKLASQGFSLESMIGKTLCSISDAQVTARHDTATIAEQLKAISGEDAVSVSRKYKSDWIGKLSVRFIFASNEIPAIVDKSGALASRLIMLRFENSMLGKEDTTLTNRLESELVGILNWAIEGLDRLRHRGNFIQPALSQELINEVERLGSPVISFVSECCAVGSAGYRVAKDMLYSAYKQWCDDNKQRANSKEYFGRDLKAAYPKLIKPTRPANPEWTPTAGPHVPRQYQAYDGIRLLSTAERIEGKVID